MAEVYANYAGLMRYAAAHGQDGLGGTLLYAGELDAAGRILAIAGNIAGAATLAATAHQDAAKQAMREGAVDFVVTNLDEALRILKNQVRKHEPAAVCVGAARENVEREMTERGVLPDVLHAGGLDDAVAAQFVAAGAQRARVEPFEAGETLFTIEIPVALMRELARVEEILAASLAENDLINRRWLRLSPRYLGPSARRVRSVVCANGAVAELKEQLRQVSSEAVIQ